MRVRDIFSGRSPFMMLNYACNRPRCISYHSSLSLSNSYPLRQIHGRTNADHARVISCNLLSEGSLNIICRQTYSGHAPMPKSYVLITGNKLGIRVRG